MSRSTPRGSRRSTRSHHVDDVMDVATDLGVGDVASQLGQLFDDQALLSYASLYLSELGLSRDSKLPSWSETKSYLSSRDAVDVSTLNSKSFRVHFRDIMTTAMSALPSSSSVVEEEVEAVMEDIHDVVDAAFGPGGCLAPGAPAIDLPPLSPPGRRVEVVDDEVEVEVDAPAAPLKKNPSKRKVVGGDPGASGSGSGSSNKTTLSLDEKKKIFGSLESLHSHLRSRFIVVDDDDVQKCFDLFHAEVTVRELHESLESTYALDLSSKEKALDALKSSSSDGSYVEHKMSEWKKRMEEKIGECNDALLNDSRMDEDDLLDAGDCELKMSDAALEDYRQRKESLESRLNDESYVSGRRAHFEEKLQKELADATSDLDQSRSQKSSFDMFRSLYTPSSFNLHVAKKKPVSGSGLSTNKKQKVYGRSKPTIPSASEVEALPESTLPEIKSKLDAHCATPADHGYGVSNARMVECKCSFCNKKECDHGSASCPLIQMRGIYVRADGSVSDVFDWEAYCTRTEANGPSLFGPNKLKTITKPNGKHYKSHASNVWADTWGALGVDSNFGYDQSFDDDHKHLEGVLSKSGKDPLKKEARAYLMEKGRLEGFPFTHFLFRHVDNASADNHTFVLIPRKFYSGPDMLSSVFGDTMKHHKGEIVSHRERMNKILCKGLFGDYGWKEGATYTLVDTPVGGPRKPGGDNMAPRRIYNTLWFKDATVEGRGKRHEYSDRIKKHFVENGEPLSEDQVRYLANLSNIEDIKDIADKLARGIVVEIGSISADAQLVDDGVGDDEETEGEEEE